MKPMHLLVVVAVIAVGALVYLMRDDDEARTSRTSKTRIETAAPSPAPAADETVRATEDGRAQATWGALSLTVKILGTDGEPAAGATLAVTGPARIEARADAAGAVAVEGLAPGVYVLFARLGDATAAKTVTLESTLDAGELRLVESVAIRGRVYDERNRPIQGATVEAVVREPMRGMDMSTLARLITEPGEIAARATTDAKGAYELRVPKGGTLGLRAFATGRAQEGDAPRTYATSADGVDFYLFPGVALAGRVVDGRDRPVPGARVMVLDPMSIFGRGAPKIETTTGLDGAFALALTPMDQALIIVRAPGFASFMQDDLELPRHDWTIRLEAGIRVTLRTVREDQPQVPAPEVNVAVMFNGNFAMGVTGADGRLTIEHLPAERSGGMGSGDKVMCWGGGFVPSQKDLQADAVKDGVLAVGDVALARGGVIRGEVVDKSSGDPIAGAEVRVFGGNMNEIGMFGAARASSDEKGAFELRGVPLDATILLAQHRDYQMSQNPMMLMMAARQGGTPLFSEGQTELERTIELTPAAVITGVVVDPEGTPVAGATVVIRDEMMMGLALMLGMGAHTATTDAEGTFTLRGLMQGQAVPVVAAHRDYGAASPKRARAGDPAITLRLTPPLTLRGRVKDDTGEPVVGARVTVTPAGQERRRGMNPFESVGVTRPGVTDEKGAFVIRNAPPGKLALTVMHPRFAEKTTAVDANASQQERDLGEIVLERGHGLAGVVLGPDGEPLERAQISAQLHGTAPTNEGRTWASVHTDGEGRFEMYGLQAGEYQLTVHAAGTYAPPLVRPTGEMELRIELRQAGSVKGRVIGDGGRPVAGAVVRAVVGENSIGWERTGADGRFVLDALPPDRAFQVLVSHDAYAELKAEARTAPTEQVFRLDAGLRVAGRVVDEQGRGVPNVTVFVRQGTSFVRNVDTDGDGRFVAGGLGAGAATVSMSGSNRNFMPVRPVTVEPGADDVEFVAREGERITGRVVDAAGEPVRQVQIAALDAKNGHVASTWVWKADGEFELGGLPPGTYTLRVTRHRPGNQEPTFTDHEGVASGTRGVEIVFVD